MLDEGLSGPAVGAALRRICNDAREAGPLDPRVAQLVAGMAQGEAQTFARRVAGGRETETLLREALHGRLGPASAPR